MTYEEINAAYRDLQGYYIEKIEEACNGRDSVCVNLVDERDIMLAEGGYLPQQDAAYELIEWKDCYVLFQDWNGETFHIELEDIGVDGLRDILQSIKK